MIIHLLDKNGMIACKTAAKGKPAATSNHSEITCKRCISIATGGSNGGRKSLNLTYAVLRIGFYPDDFDWLKDNRKSQSEIIRMAVHKYRWDNEVNRIKKRVVIAVTSNSGGSGKTTTTRNLGYELIRQGKKVLLVDLDPQANLDLFCGLISTPTHPDGDVTNIFSENFNGIWPCSEIEGEDLKIVRGSPEIARVQINLSGRRNREKCLTKALKSLPPEYDVVLLDCPATTGLLIENALAAASHVLIPIAPEEKSIQGLGDLLSGLAKLGADLDIDPPKLLGVVLSTRANSKSLTSRTCMEGLKEISEVLNFEVLPGIGEYEDLRKANASGMPLRRYRPGHQGVLEYQRFANRIQELLGGVNGKA
jgi:chromosome partitioning protein